MIETFGEFNNIYYLTIKVIMNGILIGIITFLACLFKLQIQTFVFDCEICCYINVNATKY